MIWLEAEPSSLTPGVKDGMHLAVFIDQTRVVPRAAARAGSLRLTGA